MLLLALLCWVSDKSLGKLCDFLSRLLAKLPSSVRDMPVISDSSLSENTN